jgi:hypothetical protein
VGDYSKGGFWVACLAEGVVFFFVRNNASGLGRLLGVAVSGLIAYFVYLAYRKSQAGEALWSGEDIGAGFLVALTAGWVPLLLSLVFGWGPNYYLGL